VCANTTTFMRTRTGNPKAASAASRIGATIPRFFAWRCGLVHCHPCRVLDNASETKTFILQPASYIEKLDWSRVFARAQPVEVELGSGDGSFLAQYAKLHPERNFLGVERLLGRLRKLNKKSLRNGLGNIALLRLEASYTMEFLVAPGSITALHVYFPDPWPKRKHRKNRLINDRFTEVAAKTLAPNGIVYLRTDDLDYFEQMTRVFSANKAFGKIETPPDLAAVVTDFERNFHARGVATNRAAYRKL
jgi:tRNA (guanine-N7-)-methyltransferase